MGHVLWLDTQRRTLSPQANFVPLFRYFRWRGDDAGQHFYTIDSSEMNGEIAENWRFEEVQCYVMPPPPQP